LSPLGDHSGVSEPVSVRVDRDADPAVVAPESYEATGGFGIAIRNEGPPTHVHVSFSGDLGRVVTVEEGTHFLEADRALDIDVAADPGADTASGELQIATGYGAEEATVAVTVERPPEVPVDESLTRPASGQRSQDEPTLDAPLWPTLGVAGTVVVLAVALAATIGEGLALLVGGLVVLAGLGVAAWLLRSERP
jgi:hypothetical protein